MALLSYANIEERRPDVLMRKTFSGLQEFYKFLNATKSYLESPKAVRRLSWVKIDQQPNDDDDEKSDGVWVQLTEPEGDSSNIDATLKIFLHEDNKAVYEAGESNWLAIGTAARECTICKNKDKTAKVSYQSEAHAAEIAANSNDELGIYKCEHGQGWHLTKDLSGKLYFPKDHKIEILDRDPDKEQLKLERLPTERFLVIRPNTYQINCQIKAIRQLQDAPSLMHRPLLRLFEASSHAKWGDVADGYWESSGVYHDFSSDRYADSVSEWHVLTDGDRQGTSEQREWVNICLNTPDFAFLEGPPGSGKTTAICELIIQSVLRDERVLLCASTHIAVDNVIERLMSDTNKLRDTVLPIRIGDDGRKISRIAQQWQLKNFIKTERKRLLRELNKVKQLSSAQQELLEQLNAGQQTIERMILEAANLVCGTTIGILQHPDIKNKEKQNPPFDLMIIDEASKTTFQEFLVPALLAERWILVGDPKQLSPYVDDESMAVNIESCLADSDKREACFDVFRVAHKKNTTYSLVGCENRRVIEYYEQQAKSKNVAIGTEKSTASDMPYSDIVIGSRSFLEENQDILPLDISSIGHPELVPDAIERRASAYRRLSGKLHESLEENTWQTEVAWRLTRLYEQRLDPTHDDEEDSELPRKSKKSTSARYRQEIDLLLPHGDGRDIVWEAIDRVRRVALPSILESLQDGFERNKRQKDGTALSDGLPSWVKEARSVTLTWQHRMHPDIARFSHEHIYEGKALLTPEDMEERRGSPWTYRSEGKRCIWQDVKGKKDNNNINTSEVDHIMQELRQFDKWARSNPNLDDYGKQRPWEVAVLTFYRGQERALRRALRNWTGQKKEFRYFYRGSQTKHYIDIQVCVVDRFQGHEADFVLLSFASHYPTSFLASPNRLNVAITRARYQLIVLGNRNGLGKASGLLGNFVRELPYEKLINSKKQRR